MPQQLLGEPAQHDSGNADQSANTKDTVVRENPTNKGKSIYGSNRLNYLEILSNFTNQPLEWQLPDQELSTLLVLANFTERLQHTETRIKFNVTLFH